MHFLVNFFLLFCDILTLGELLNASGLRKYKKFEIVLKMSFLGVCYGLKDVFFHEILKKPQILVFSHVYNIFPYSFCFYI